MYVLLPPSETKATGGSGPGLDLAELSFPSLTPTRERLVRALPAGPAGREAGGEAGGVAGPTMPAVRRYTGVLYTALDVPGLTATQYHRAAGRVLICSALFGLLAATDPIPSYRFSAGSRLPGVPPVPALWRPPLTAVLAALDEPVLDLRSGAYAAFAAAPGAITVRVHTVTKSGQRAPVSHANKFIKGVLARLVATTRAEVGDVAGLLRLSRRAGLVLERTGPHSVDLIAPGAR